MTIRSFLEETKVTTVAMLINCTMTGKTCHTASHRSRSAVTAHTAVGLCRDSTVDALLSETTFPAHTYTYRALIILIFTVSFVSEGTGVWKGQGGRTAVLCCGGQSISQSINQSIDQSTYRY